MLERLFRRKPKTIQVNSFPPTAELIFDVNSLSELKRNFKKIVETPNAYYANDEDGVFYRFRKGNFKPITRHIKYATYHPEQNMVVLDRKELESIATTYNSELLETNDAVLLLTSGLVFISPKTHEEIKR